MPNRRNLLAQGVVKDFLGPKTECYSEDEAAQIALAESRFVRKVKRLHVGVQCLSASGDCPTTAKPPMNVENLLSVCRTMTTVPQVLMGKCCAICASATTSVDCSVGVFLANGDGGFLLFDLLEFWRDGNRSLSGSMSSLVLSAVLDSVLLRTHWGRKGSNPMSGKGKWESFPPSK